MITFAAVVPHAPLLIPGIGKEEELKKLRDTIDSLNVLREEIEQKDIDTLVVITPHTCPQPHSFALNNSFFLSGSFSKFGLRKKYRFRNDRDLVSRIQISCALNELADEQRPIYIHKSQLDHGALVPLYYLTKNFRPRILHLSFSFTNFSLHYDFGDAIGKILTVSTKRIAVIASGDLSHRIFEKKEGEVESEGEIFDRKIIKLMKDKKINEIIHFSQELEERVDECFLPSMAMIMGILKNENYNFKILSYEAPFGIGYLVGKLL